MQFTLHLYVMPILSLYVQLANRVNSIARNSLEFWFFYFLGVAAKRFVSRASILMIIECIHLQSPQ